ncbi:YopX family protein [Enterococcus casseliflavus]|uniref:YopX family protein n=1 Tax=Enterococcus casseliflavus TaxID=37734 RepID=UPI002DBC8C9D|nr:YopX family protein [Enterococcus casseliflavus]MEB8400972.1 YopX family protein [Enterococcus casseliflavus]
MVPKFRAFLTETKTIHDVLQIDLSRSMVSLKIENASEWYWFKEVVLMQSTGLKDKNSVEIYCGDAVEWLGHRGIVEFVLNNQQTMIIGASGYITDLDYSTDFNTAVIGNIHENPKILGQANES